MLFKGTLKDNIIVRYPDASDEEILVASTISGTKRFVDIHPMGFDMPVGERGEGLSGGQKLMQYHRHSHCSKCHTHVNLDQFYLKSRFDKPFLSGIFFLSQD